MDTLGDIAAIKAIETVCDCWATKLMVDTIEDTRNGIGRGVKQKCQSTHCVTNQRKSRSMHLVTHWPRCEADALVDKLADRQENKTFEALGN